MFTAALFTIAKTCKRPKYSSTEEWIKMMWYIYTMEYYSAIKKNEIMPYSIMDGPRDYRTKWRKSETERQTSYNITYVWNLKKGYKWTYFQNRNRQTLKINLWLPKETSRGEGWIGDLGIGIRTLWYMDDWVNGICCMAQRTLSNILWLSIWEKNLKENGCVYMYNWITLLYSRNYHNTVNQLYVNKDFF